MVLFHGEVQKSPSDYNALIQRMKSFIDPKEPRLAQILTRLWGNQQNAITYRELRTAIMAGEIDEATVAAWQQDYSSFVVSSLLPVFKEIIAIGAEELQRGCPNYRYDPHAPAIESWTSGHSAELIRGITAEQRGAVNALIMRYSTKPDISVDELARYIRPTIGLNMRQTAANASYHDKVKENFIKTNPHMRAATAERKASEAAARYAATQHRYRAMMIARTELMTAYSEGAAQASRDAYDKGLLGRYNKRWVTADDGRCCSHCKALDGKEVSQGESFSTDFGFKPTSPLHPHCRCIVISVEIESVTSWEGERNV